MHNNSWQKEEGETFNRGKNASDCHIERRRKRWLKEDDLPAWQIMTWKRKNRMAGANSIVTAETYLLSVMGWKKWRWWVELVPFLSLIVESQKWSGRKWRITVHHSRGKTFIYFQLKRGSPWYCQQQPEMKVLVGSSMLLDVKPQRAIQTDPSRLATHDRCQKPKSTHTPPSWPERYE